MDHGDKPAMVHLLTRRRISDDTRAAALQKVNAAGVGAGGLLETYRGYTDKALADEVGSPASGPVTWLPLYYTLYVVPKKLVQGRPVSALDWGLAVADPVLMFAGPLNPSAVVKEGGRAVVKQIGERAMKEASEVMVQKLGEAATRNLAGRGFRVAAKEAAESTGTYFSREVLSALQREAAEKIARYGAVEITGPVRLAFKGTQATGAGRRLFKAVTKLEARLFMRRDGRVIVRFDRLAASYAPLLYAVAEDVAVSGSLESISRTEAAEAAVEKLAELASSVGESVRDWTRDDLPTFNAATWWAVLLTDAADLLGDGEATGADR